MPSLFIRQTALSTLEKGLNKLIAMDPLAIEQLAVLEGKKIAIHSTTPHYSFSIIPTLSSVFLTTQDDQLSDVKLIAPPLLLVQLLLTKDKESFLKNSGLMIVGESAVLYQFFRVFDKLNPDWEHELSQWFGPSIIGLVTQSIQQGSSQLKQGINSVQSQIVNLFGNNTINSSSQEKPYNPLTRLLDSLQNRFGKS